MILGRIDDDSILCLKQLLVLDEPTNNLDLDTVRPITEGLAAFEGARGRFQRLLGLINRPSPAKPVVYLSKFPLAFVVHPLLGCPRMPQLE